LPQAKRRAPLLLNLCVARVPVDYDEASWSEDLTQTAAPHSRQSSERFMSVDDLKAHQGRRRQAGPASRFGCVL